MAILRKKSRILPKSEPWHDDAVIDRLRVQTRRSFASSKTRVIGDVCREDPAEMHFTTGPPEGLKLPIS
jgi:hypothetical protein